MPRLSSKQMKSMARILDWGWTAFPTLSIDNKMIMWRKCMDKMVPEPHEIMGGLNLNHSGTIKRDEATQRIEKALEFVRRASIPTSN